MFRCSILRDLSKRYGNNLKYGGVAQLGEHLPCKQGVMGSNPIISTSTKEVRHKGKPQENSEVAKKAASEYDGS